MHNIDWHYSNGKSVSHNELVIITIKDSTLQLTVQKNLATDPLTGAKSLMEIL